MGRCEVARPPRHRRCLIARLSFLPYLPHQSHQPYLPHLPYPLHLPFDQQPLRRPDVVYVPTPDTVVAAMLKLANVTAADVVYDLGSGDGRIPIAAATL